MLKHIRDIEADLSAFHRVDNMWSMDGPRFFAFAYRLPAYNGVIRALAEKQAMEQEKRTGGRDVVPIAGGELNRVEGLAGVTEDAGDGAVWLSLEKATD